MASDVAQPVEGLEAWLWDTPNSNRVSILFEEIGLHYAVHGVNIRNKEQFAPDILALNPYGKIPIVRWTEAGATRVLFESGAILLRFGGEASGLTPSNTFARDDVLQWLMVVLTGLGPLSGQAHHWTELAPERSEPAERHIVALVDRVYRFLNSHLQHSEFLSSAYSIADIAAFPWVARSNWTSLSLSDYPFLERWHAQLSERPAVIRGMAVPKGARLQGPPA
ncbi:glutathione S-transferase C-terminal domain-containing protein [Devosia sp.]|uniref:glutathione S-transferase family protein n=1 Tax=Devosia sp. TaxID=1871048 RepID=UPI001AC665BF|nr:glutathione S-transferase C-terminal domain-containing protein [Devosia sp.]MBN9334894.1 glutathione S-transferase N-terminal domain-containing protein [Devosia sp.]